MNILQNIDLRSFNTLAVPANAAYFIEVASLAELQQALEFSREKRRSPVVIGGGSNVVFTGDIDVAFVSFVESVKDRHQRRFARAVFPDDPMDRAGHDADRDVFIGLYRTKGLGDAFQLDRRSGSFLPLRMCCSAHA